MWNESSVIKAAVFPFDAATDGVHVKLLIYEAYILWLLCDDEEILF